MTPRGNCPPAPGLLEDYAREFDQLFSRVAQRGCFRDCLVGLLLPRDRNRTVTGLAGAAPIVQAQAAPVQRLQWFLSEANWEVEAVNDRRIALLVADPVTRPHGRGVLMLDETGDRKDGTKTAHVGYQYLGSVGKIANGIVAVSSAWADEGVYYPLHIRPYEPAARLARGKADPAFRTKPALAVELAAAARAAGIPFEAVVADSVYGENATFEGVLWGAHVPYVLSVHPSRGSWGPAEAAHTPEDAAHALRWTSAEEPSAVSSPSVGGPTCATRHSPSSTPSSRSRRPPSRRSRRGGKPGGARYVPQHLLSWPVALRQVRGWLAPWTMLWRWWRAWSTAPPPPPFLALLDALDRGRSLPSFSQSNKLPLSMCWYARATRTRGRRPSARDDSHA